MPIHQEKQACLLEMRDDIAKNVFKQQCMRIANLAISGYKIRNEKQLKPVCTKEQRNEKKKFMKHAKLNHRINVPMSSANKNQFHIALKR